MRSTASSPLGPHLQASLLGWSPEQLNRHTANYRDWVAANLFAAAPTAAEPAEVAPATAVPALERTPELIH
jgi:hypothetical protein